MTEKHIQDAKVLNRLRRVEGQLRGLQGMIEKGETSREILIQYSAVHSALTKVGYVIVNDAMADSIHNNLSRKKTEHEAVSTAMKTFLKYAEHLK